MSQNLLDNSAASTIGATGSDSAMGIAALGQALFALIVVVGIILLFYMLIRRLSKGGSFSRRHMTVVCSTMVGSKERVVIVDVEGTWLVLGVGNGQVNKLHELPRPLADPAEQTDQALTGTFAERFCQALKRTAP